MQDPDRRAFLGTALAKLPLAMLAQTVETKVKPVRVPSGEGRLGEHHVIGVSSTAFKVLTDDIASALFVIDARKAVHLVICITTRMSGSTLSKVR